LASGASRVMALTVASAPPGLRDAAIASLKRSTAAFSPSETSVIVRDTSVAVSMARSAMPGWRDGPGVSIVIGQPLARIRMKSPTFGYPRQAPLRTAGDGLSWGNVEAGIRFQRRIWQVGQITGVAASAREMRRAAGEGGPSGC